MEERKSMGGALVDVFDAGVALAKTEINSVTRKVGDTAKAKGLGVVLLLAAIGPLIMALIFLILFVFYAMMRFFGWHPWAASLAIAVLSLLVTAALVFLGLKRLGAEVKTDEPLVRRTAMNDDIRDPADSTTPTNSTVTPLTSKNASLSPARGTAASTPDDRTPPAAKVELDRDGQNHAAGETRVVAERPGSATIRVEEGTTTVPVYESDPDGSPKMYGSGLNEKLEGQNEAGAGSKSPVNNPVTLRNAPGIAVSTDPTYKDDMKKGES